MYDNTVEKAGHDAGRRKTCTRTGLDTWMASRDLPQGIPVESWAGLPLEQQQWGKRKACGLGRREAVQKGGCAGCGWHRGRGGVERGMWAQERRETGNATDLSP